MSQPLIEFRQWRRCPILTAVAVAAIVLVTMLNPATANPQTYLLNKGCSQYNVTNLSAFYTNLNNTLSDLMAQLSGANTKFATATHARGSDPVYAMSQCRDYLSTVDCVACFNTAITQIRNCSAATGARAIYDGCFLRGYTAPEYAIHGQLTEKVDTFSFGIVVLEIISGRKCNEIKTVDVDRVMDYLLEQAWKLYEDDMHLKLVDDILKDSNGYTDEAANKIIKVALMCTQTPASSRPTMSEVVILLSDHSSMDLVRPARRAFMDNNKKVLGDTSTSSGASATNATASITEVTGR